MNYCNGCKKSLTIDNFDKKKRGGHYTRCKICRIKHNTQQNKSYDKCNAKRALCDNKDCDKCFNKSFASYDGLTDKNKKKVDCWSVDNDKKPREVSKFSNNKYWFDCEECKHSFESVLYNITGRKSWCPYCSKPCQKLCDKDCVFCLKNSFASFDEKKVDCWSNENDKKPRDVFKFSHKKYWFDCEECKHSFESSLGHITENRWCPYCANKKLCDKDNCECCLNKSFASFDKKKVDCWSDENDKKPRDVFKSSHKKYWFDCKECKHSFESSLNTITLKNCWCPYCSKKKLCDKDNCDLCLNNSFASFDINKVECWSNDNDKNPRYVFKCSGKKYWFDCKECKHSFESSLNSITGKNSWCPYCAKPCQKLCDQDNCKFCLNNSFASFDINKVECWSNENNKKPRDVSKSSHKKYWFDCKGCKHSFESSLASITHMKSWCPYCANKKLCDKDNCEFCLNNSFASFDINKVECWSVENNKKPRDVFKGSETKYWFDCKECKRSFHSSLKTITGRNSWCPLCKTKTELKFINWYPQKFTHKIDHQARFDWCKNPKTSIRLPFDTCVEELKLIIEIDGRQHFEQVMNWKCPKDQQDRDIYKMNKAIEQGYTIIRILQEDIWYDRNNWEENTIEIINKVINKECGDCKKFYIGNPDTYAVYG